MAREIPKQMESVWEFSTREFFLLDRRLSLRHRRCECRAGFGRADIGWFHHRCQHQARDQKADEPIRQFGQSERSGETIPVPVRHTYCEEGKQSKQKEKTDSPEITTQRSSLCQHDGGNDCYANLSAKLH